MPKVSIHLVSWNSIRFLPSCLKSIFAQTFKDFSVMVVDNASQDETVAFIRENYPQVQLIENRKNQGFARAHNQAIHFTASEYVLVINPDIILEPDFLEELVKVMDQEPKVGSLGGKLKRFWLDREGLPEIEKSNIIDSCGLKAFKSRRFTERGAGEEDKGQFDHDDTSPGPKNFREVFGISGALVLYRRKALEEIKFKEEFYDEDFFSYKEDIDLAWRLRLYGWKAVYVPKALAYHWRFAYTKEKSSNLEVIRGRKFKSSLVNHLSYRNHFYLLIKNELLRNFILHFPWILWYEIKKIIYIMIFETRTLKGLIDLFKNLRKMRLKRMVSMGSRKISAKELRYWFE